MSVGKYFGVIKKLMALRRTRVQGTIEHGTTRRNKNGLPCRMVLAFNREPIIDTTPKGGFALEHIHIADENKTITGLRQEDIQIQSNNRCLCSVRREKSSMDQVIRVKVIQHWIIVCLDSFLKFGELSKISKSKVTNFELAVCIDKKMARLGIVVEHIGAVNIFKSTEGLVKEGLEVCMCQISQEWKRMHDNMKISFHQFFLM
ncbi:hypothetical protein BDR06DRAFT_976396 [Suillus hirtellus]|nr:hypothetical protein BDR06DRAFT_976396 [Suillus hirtellus]